MKKLTQLIVAALAVLAITSAAQAAELEPGATAYGRIIKSNLPPLPADWKNPAWPPQEPVVPLNERYLVKPILDTPMRAPSICKGPDGTYYLTGTLGVKKKGEGRREKGEGRREKGEGSVLYDFENSHQIKLWKSSDLKTWTDLGVVFDPLKGKGKAISPATPGATSPEIHYLKNTFWIAFSMNGESTCLLKSASGKAEGPYELMGKNGDFTITIGGNDPSLFQDDDGSVYWLWSPAWIAKMNDDMTGLAEPPRLLTCEPQNEHYHPAPKDKDVPPPNDAGDVLVGRRGPFLWKAKGIYHLAVSDVISRNGIFVEDTLVATSKTLFGIYSKRGIMIPHGCQTTVFQDDKGNYRATFCGNDRYAAFRDKAGIVPLEWVKSFKTEFYSPDGALIANLKKVYTERGPWHKLLPCFQAPGFYIRDHHVMQAPDGYFYVSGSVHGDPYVGKLTIYRSRDLKDWEEILVRTFDDEKQWPEAKRKYRSIGKDGKIILTDYNQYYMSTAINWVPKLKTFVISYDGWNGGEPKGIPANGWLISTTGKGEGPYEVMPKGCQNNCAKFLEDDDGSFFFSWGINGLNRLNDDFSIKERLPNVSPAAGGIASEDANCAIVKMHGKYVFFVITCRTSPYGRDYGYAYMTADSPKGPWSKLMPGLRHGAWGPPFRGLDGHWYASTFGDDIIGSFYQQIGIVRLKTELKDGQVLIDIDDDWTPADYKPVDKYQGPGKWSPYTDFEKGVTK